MLGVKTKVVRLIILLAAVAATLPNAMAAETREIGTTQSAASRIFRIGYLHGDPEAQLRPGVFYQLRDFLLKRTALRDEMTSAGISDIVLLSSDSHENLIERMSHNEFDLAFCSAKDFVSQAGDYNAIYQLKRASDRFDPRGQRVFHFGEIFVNNRCELFKGELSPERLQRYFKDCDRIALVSSFSAAGYDYPLLKIAEVTTNTLPSGIMFCQSSEEVVKHVMNGVSEVGACDAGVLDKVLERNELLDEKAQLVRVILQTAVIPTDPVALQTNWVPRESAFAQEMIQALREFFRPDAGLPRLQSSSNDKYEDLRQNVLRLRDLPR